MLVGAYTELGLGRVGLRRWRAGRSGSSTAAAGALDRRIRCWASLRPGSLTANFHVVATVGS